MLRHELLHICGPVSIHSYGFAIALGLFIFSILFLRHPGRAQLLSREKCLEIISIALVSGILGARLLYVINSWDRFESFGEFFHIWSGGLSMLGGLIAILVVVPLYLSLNQ